MKLIFLFFLKILKTFFIFYRLRNISIVSCSNRDTSLRDLTIMTLDPGFSLTEGQRLVATGWGKITNDRREVLKVSYQNRLQIIFEKKNRGVDCGVFSEKLLLFPFQNFNKFDAGSNVLRKVALPFLDAEACNVHFDNMNQAIQICAGAEKGMFHFYLQLL